MTSSFFPRSLITGLVGLSLFCVGLNQWSVTQQKQVTFSRSIEQSVGLISKEVRQPLGHAMIHLTTSPYIRDLSLNKGMPNIQVVNINSTTSQSIVVVNQVSQHACVEIFHQIQKNARETLWQFNGKVFHGNPPLNEVCFTQNQIAAKAV